MNSQKRDGKIPQAVNFETIDESISNVWDSLRGPMGQDLNIFSKKP